MMRRIEGLSSFLVAADGDCYCSTEEFLVWRKATDLLGLSVWGERDRGSFEQQACILDHFTEPPRPRQRVLIDAARCREPNPTTFSRAVSFMAARRARHAASIEQLAVVVPQGLAGAVFVGVSVIIQPEFALRLFSDVSAALEWLQCENPEALAEELAGLQRMDADKSLLESLHRLFMETEFAVSLNQAARRFGMSQRTLQRRLSAARTTFHAELSKAKLAMAKTLLALGGRSITTIALELGFASVQHFSARFSAVYGQSPRSWLRNRGDQLSIRLGDSRTNSQCG
jgi:AraC-like DNA-binding protein